MLSASNSAGNSDHAAKTQRLQALVRVLVRDSSEVAREYDQKRSQQKSTHKFTETK